MGARTVDALRKMPGIDVDVASRRSACRVDLTDPSTFEALRGASEGRLGGGVAAPAWVDSASDKIPINVIGLCQTT